MLLIDKLKNSFTALSDVWVGGSYGLATRPVSNPAQPAAVASASPVTGFAASSAPGEDLWREAQVSPAFRATVENSHRWKTATPEQRAGWLRREALKAAPTARVAPIHSTPAKLTAKPAPTDADWNKLSREMDSLAAMADRAVARVRADKARAEIASLTGLDKTRAAIRAQFSGDDVVDEKKNVTKICQRSKPSANPAFVPEPSQDVRLRECNKYYSELVAEIEVELQAAYKAGRVPQELLSRKARTQKEWTLANDKILGRDIRK